MNGLPLKGVYLCTAWFRDAVSISILYVRNLDLKTMFPETFEVILLPKTPLFQFPETFEVIL